MTESMETRCPICKSLEICIYPLAESKIKFHCNNCKKDWPINNITMPMRLFELEMALSYVFNHEEVTEK